jgi:hypothetical protein
MKRFKLLKTTLAALIAFATLTMMAGCFWGHDDHHGGWDHHDDHHYDH